MCQKKTQKLLTSELKNSGSDWTALPSPATQHSSSTVPNVATKLVVLGDG